MSHAVGHGGSRDGSLWVTVGHALGSVGKTLSWWVTRWVTVGHAGSRGRSRWVTWWVTRWVTEFYLLLTRGGSFLGAI